MFNVCPFDVRQLRPKMHSCLQRGVSCRTFPKDTGRCKRKTLKPKFPVASFPHILCRGKMLADANPQEQHVCPLHIPESAHNTDETKGTIAQQDCPSL
jgi:hypothetical protein